MTTAPNAICADCARRLVAWRDTQAGVHLMPHKTPTGGVCAGHRRLDHQLERPALL